MHIKNGLDLSQLKGTTWGKWEGFSFPRVLFVCKVSASFTQSASALLHWVGLKLHSTVWKKIEFIIIQLPYFGRKKECKGLFFPRTTVNQEVSQFFGQKSKRERGWGNLNLKRIWEAVKVQPAYNFWVIVTAWTHLTSKLQAWDGSNRHQLQGTLLLPSRFLVTSFPFEALLLLKLKSASNSSFCFFRNSARPLETKAECGLHNYIFLEGCSSLLL